MKPDPALLGQGRSMQVPGCYIWPATPSPSGQIAAVMTARSGRLMIERLPSV